MKTADQARMAMKSFDPETLPGFKKVENAIESAIRDNKHSVYLDGSFDSRLMDYLRTLGYSAELTNDRNETITIISWQP